MIVDTRGIEVSETVWINKPGRFLLRIEKIDDDGYTQSGDPKIKMQFKGIETTSKEVTYMHTERFNLGQKSLWVIKLLEKALHAPEVYDVNDFIGRYVIANIKEEKYTKNDGSQGTAYKVASWEYSSLNDKMPPIEEAVQDQADVANGVEVVIEDAPVIDTNEDAIPF